MDLDKKYWNKRYNELDIGWNVGYITSPILEYFSQIKDKKLRILIPGSGYSHEGEYLYNNNFINTHILDFSSIALSNFKKRMPEFPEAQIIEKDYFDLEDKFDMIVEQTFFCAIDIKKRKSYIKKTYDLLEKNGKIVGLFFDNKFNNNKPPFGCSKVEYLRLLKPYFNILTFDKCYNSIKSRNGNEFFCIAKKIS